MSQKKYYSPVKIYDPSSDNHVVRVFPTQDFLLYISPSWGDVEIDYNSRFFRLASSFDIKGKTAFKFEQTHDLSDWSDISRTFLGDILVVSNKRPKDLISLSVILEAFEEENRAMLTVINPVSAQLKIEDHQTVHVIVYDERLESNQTWDCRSVEGRSRLRFYEAFHAEVPPEHTSDHTDALRQCKNLSVNESHFFFRCENVSKLAAADMSEGIVPAGKLIFAARGEDHSFFRHDLELSLDIRKPKANDKLLADHGLVSKKHHRRKKKRKHHNHHHHHSTEFDRMDGEGGNSHYPIIRSGGGDNNWSHNYPKGGGEHHPHGKVKDIKLRELEEVSLDSNCKVVEFDFDTMT